MGWCNRLRRFPDSPNSLSDKRTSRQQQLENDLVDTLNHVVPSLYVPSPSPRQMKGFIAFPCAIESRGHGQLFSAHTTREGQRREGGRGSKSERMSIVIALSRSMKIVLGRRRRRRRWRSVCLRLLSARVLETHLAVILTPKGKRRSLAVRVTVSLGFYSLS